MFNVSSFRSRSVAVPHSWLAVAAVLLATLLRPGVLPAQDLSRKINIGEALELPGLSKISRPASGAKITLEPADAKPGDTVTVRIVITTADDAYTYSMDESFAGRTRIEIRSAAGLTEIDRTFTSDRQPKAEQDSLLDQRVEKFPGGVTWTRRFQVAADADPADVHVTGTLRYQICDATSCRPFNEKFDLSLDAEKKEPVFSQRFAPTMRDKGKVNPGPSEWTLTLSPADAKPGDTVTVTVSAKLKDGFHTFAIDHDKKNIGLPTVIDVNSSTGLQPLGDGFQADREVELHEEEGKTQRIHHNEVSWSRSFAVTVDAATAGYGVAGRLSYQVCDALRCIPYKFDFELGRVAKKVAETASVAGAVPSKPISIGDGSSRFDSIQYREPGAEEAVSSLSMYLLYAFLGGLILNVMPCVLPVIAIKVLSFVQQAGESRGRILLLNASYSVGVLTVFMVLATLAAFAGMAWGGLFQHAIFIIAMAALVFVMALSLLGVFELPVPGMVGSVGAAQREGLSGAFLTGIFATLLATPCSGPFLGTTLGWSVQQEPHVIYAVWSVMALGMASPYLLFGLFPGAVKLLPKPGNWMVRFKQIAGFVLLGTTVYLISILGQEYVLPTLILLLGLGLGVWMVGNLYTLSSPPALRWKVRALALILTGGIAGFGYQIHEGGDELPWEPFSTDALATALDEGRPVLVDFTADWCPNCKLVERISLNRKETRDFVSEHNVKTLKADYTNFSDEITMWLERFDSTSIPVTAVFSPARPTEPLLIRDVYTQSTLLEVLETAASETQADIQTTSLDRSLR
jgi:suppressor for copper-sensitivity B